MPGAKCSSCGAKLPRRARASAQSAAPGRMRRPGRPPCRRSHRTRPGRFRSSPTLPSAASSAFRPRRSCSCSAPCALVGAIVLFATGQWPWGLILLGLAIFMLTGFSSQARRLPGETSGVGRASLAAVRLRSCPCRRDSRDCRGSQHRENRAQAASARSRSCGLRADGAPARARRGRLRRKPIGDEGAEGNDPRSSTTWSKRRRRRWQT